MPPETDGGGGTDLRVVLNAMFRRYCEVLRDRLDNDPKATDLAVIRQFFKDNHIDALPVPGSAFGDLADAAAAKGIIDFPFRPGNLLPEDDPAVAANGEG